MDQYELKANAKPFVTVDPAAQDGDLAVLGPMVGTASIVGLGEARALVEDKGMWVGGLLGHGTEARGWLQGVRDHRL